VGPSAKARSFAKVLFPSGQLAQLDSSEESQANSPVNPEHALDLKTQSLRGSPAPLSENSQLLRGSLPPPLVEACVHVVADAAAPAQSLFAPPSLVVQVEALKLGHVEDVGSDTSAQAEFVPSSVTVHVGVVTKLAVFALWTLDLESNLPAEQVRHAAFVDSPT
jgi:hypothetical protein